MKNKLISDETYAKIAHMDWNELAYEYEKLEAELAMYERDETFGTLAIRLVKLEAENEALGELLDALVERAERVQEGEGWDLAKFILRKAKP